ncbi:MAG: SMP-30/gluconolactonase/LRE family protein, partial [Calditrichaceae bacterium]
NAIYKWSADSDTSTYRKPSGRSNGLTLDLDGNIIIAGHSARHIARLESPDSITILANEYNGKKFNSPNDIVVKSDGSIWFTDPDFGLNDIHGTPELDFCGVYRLSPSGEVQLMDSTFSLPNGICFSPDESLLYVDESDPAIRKIYVWDVVNDSTITNKRLFASVDYINNFSCYLDGMKTDDDGRLYSCSVIGVLVFDTTGTPIDTILVPYSVTNCNWGDEDGKTLYITAGGAVYKIRKTYTKITNPDNRQGSRMPDTFKLLSNYPNPFNAATRIPFYLAKSGKVQIDILNTLGEKVVTLVNQSYSAGHHVINWYADQFSSGLYFIRLATSKGSVLQKCLLMK